MERGHRVTWFGEDSEWIDRTSPRVERGRLFDGRSYICSMELSPEERATLEAEWAKGNKWGATLARQKAFATIVSSAVFGICILPAIVLLSLRLFIVGMCGGVPLGMFVRRKLMPKGQFGER